MVFILPYFNNTTPDLNSVVPPLHSTLHRLLWFQYSPNLSLYIVYSFWISNLYSLSWIRVQYNGELGGESGCCHHGWWTNERYQLSWFLHNSAVEFVDFLVLWFFFIVCFQFLFESFAGTRFRPLSFNTPKPLFPLAGQPMVHHPISACKRVCIFSLQNSVLFCFRFYAKKRNKL